MAGSCFSFPNSLFPSTFQCGEITAEQFNLFHKIDRELFSLLIVNLGREPSESMQVMAFLLFLERERHGPFNLVKKILVSLSPALINQLADEVVVCLKCIESDIFEFTEVNDLFDISLLQSLMDGKCITLQTIHENRVSVLRGVTKIVNEVCARAFDDILRQFIDNQVLMNPNQAVSGGGFRLMSPFILPFYPNLGVFPQLGFGGTSHAAQLGFGSTSVASSGLDRIGMLPNPVVSIGVVNGNFSPYDLGHQREILNREVGEMMSRVNLAVAPEEENEVPPDDRTIFLTFSKGYPISESEVREFFTRKFGDFIEAIYMQEVPDDEQVLYARIVAKSASMIDAIVERDRKAKYSINGKHVWARKYVKKNSKSPPRPTGASSQPPNAAAPPPSS